MKQLSILITCTIFILTITSSQAQMGTPMGGMAPTPEATSDLEPSSIQTYKSIEGTDLKIHIFHPDNHSFSNKHPALLFFHGGGFRRGSPTQGYELSEIFNPKGVAVISVQYRLVEDGRTLDQIVADAKSSVRFVRTHAHHLGIDPDRIAVSGHSSGAYLAYAGGAINAFDETNEESKISSTANAMLLWSMGAERAERNTAALVSKGNTIADYQPAKYVTDSLPPSIFIHGDVDDLIQYKPTRAFQQTIANAGNQTSFHLVEGADHFFRNPDQKQEVYDVMLGFLDSIGYIE